MESEDMGTFDLPADRSAASRARTAAREMLRLWHVTDETSDNILLIVSELVGNAVRHGAGGPRMTLDRNAREGCVRIEVADSSPRLPALEWAASDDESGRGLYIVGVLSKEWGAERVPDGKRVWAHVPIK
jgi:anti-sigma regulatory factor (Ser/Thr protein kinase)